MVESQLTKKMLILFCEQHASSVTVEATFLAPLSEHTRSKSGQNSKKSPKRRDPFTNSFKKNTLPYWTLAKKKFRMCHTFLNKTGLFFRALWCIILVDLSSCCLHDLCTDAATTAFIIHTAQLRFNQKRGVPNHARRRRWSMSVVSLQFLLTLASLIHNVPLQQHLRYS